jgi:hypothetical protein
MRPTLRVVLADSHIAAVAIAVLLIWSLESGVRAVGPSILSAIGFLITAVAIRDNPTGFGSFSLSYWLSQIPTFIHFVDAVITLIAARVLSCWVYKMAPCQSLIECRIRLARRNHG